jgi:hypothetical protein
LLGASRVFATDLSPLADPGVLVDALREAIPSIVRDTLSPFAPHAEIRARLDALLLQKEFSIDALEKFGISYIAPLDFATWRFHVPLDFVYSNSVLEHVPAEKVRDLIANVAHHLRRGGAMAHAIHLEDHRDIAGDPFAFLSCQACDLEMPRDTWRGNRLRKSEWLKIFASVEGVQWRVLYEWKRLDRPLPPVIDSLVCHEGVEDLRVSHLGILGVKL